MLTCKEVTRLVSESLDRTLPLSQRLALRIHFMMCRYCRRFREQVIFIRALVNQLSGEKETESPPEWMSLSEQARGRILQTLEEAE